VTPHQWATFLLKAALSYALYYTGLLQVWQRVALRRRALVLMYHRVLTPEERAQTASHPALVVDRDTFGMHMQILRRRFAVLSLPEFADRMERRLPFANSSCLVTFDDGWRDTFTNALPVLEKQALPAVVFLPVNYIDTRRLFWQEALTHLLCRAVAEARTNEDKRGALELALRPYRLHSLLEMPHGDARPAVIHAVGNQKHLPVREVEGLIRLLGEVLEVCPEDYADVDGFLTWQQVERMARAGIAFGGHGAEHRLLTQVSIDEARLEIGHARRVLEMTPGCDVTSFCYPNGYVTPAVAEEVKAAGYRLAFITRRGAVSCWDDPFTIRRLNVHEAMTSSAPMFLARLVGLF